MVGISATIVIFGCLIFLLASRCKPHPTTSAGGILSILGEVIAEETASLLGDKGKVVIVTVGATRPDLPEQAMQLQAYQRAIKQHPQITVVAVEQPESNSDMRALSSRRYLALLQQYSNVDAIVSFVGAPSLDEDQINRLPSKIPKFVAVCPVTSGLTKLFRTGIVQVAIVTRSTAAPTSKQPTSSREWFDRNFQVITAANATALTF